jgi:DNA polymerase I-like protein with 3'-5' exonuclease and polymerase domains
MQKQYVTVDSRETVHDLLHHIVQSEIVAFDTETSGLNPRRDKVVGFSVSGEIGRGYYMPMRVWDNDRGELVDATIDGKSAVVIASKVIQALLGKKLVMHNSSFDVRFVTNDLKIDLLPSLHADTALLVHTVQEEGAFGYGGKPFGLKDIAKMVQQEIGLDVDKRANEEQIALKESIKKNGGSVLKEGFEIYKADLEILSEYAAADTDLTLRIYYHFLKKLQEEKLEKFFFEEEVMPIYKEVTIKMEERGILLDIPLIEKTKQDIEVDLEKHKKEVMAELLGMDKVRKWVIDQATKQYPPTAKGTFAQQIISDYDLPVPRSDKTGKYSITKATIHTLPDSPVRDFLITGDTSYLTPASIAKVSIKLWKQDNGDFFNIQSKDQMGKIAFDVLKIKPLSSTDRGKPQFDDELIASISKDHPWAEKLRVYNKLLKIKSTYIERFLDSAENGRFFPYFKQNGTVSGRYGSDLQQLPRPKEDGEAAEIIVKYTNTVRAFFISDPGYVFIDTDYQSLEPRVFAAVAGDEGLQEIFGKGWDFYSTIAIKTEKIEGMSPDPKDANFLKRLDPVKRNKAKSYSLGIPYGMSSYALAMSLNIPQKEADILVNGYLNGFPELKKWIEDSREFVKKNGYIKNKVGRIRHLPGVREIYEAVGDRILDWKVRKDLEREYTREAVMTLYRDYRNGLNQVLNYQIQSYAASIVNRAALYINRRFKEEGIDGQVVAQIHDQLVCLVREEYKERACEIIQDEMENRTTLSGVKLVAEPAVARNLKEGH